MSKWQITIANSAENDLHETYDYIANTLLEPQTALNIIRRIKAKIQKLDTSPTMYAAYPNEPWKSRGLRRVNSGNYAIFFIPAKNGKQTVTIIRIIYGGRDIDNILNDMQDDESV